MVRVFNKVSQSIVSPSTKKLRLHGCKAEKLYGKAGRRVWFWESGSFFPSVQGRETLARDLVQAI